MLQRMAFDTHAAVKMLTSAGAKEELAVAVVDIARQASAAHDPFSRVADQDGYTARAAAYARRPASADGGRVRGGPHRYR